MQVGGARAGRGGGGRLQGQAWPLAGSGSQPPRPLLSSSLRPAHRSSLEAQYSGTICLEVYHQPWALAREATCECYGPLEVAGSSWGAAWGAWPGLGGTKA